MKIRSGRRRTLVGAAAVILAGALSHLAAEAAPKTLGSGSCITGNCHVSPRDWWQADDHFLTQQAFFQDPRSQQYLSNLGVRPDDFASVNARCMNCHGTVVTDREKAPPEDGVSCESCHGPGSDYLKVHQENAKAGFAQGLVELKNVSTRGAVCVRCHYMQDPTLVNAGHPLGWYMAGTEYTSGIKQKISRHWKTHKVTPADLDPQPFLDAIAAKGPAPTPPSPTMAPAGSGAGSVMYRNVPVYIERQLSPLFFPSGPPALIDLEPFPAPADSSDPGALLRSLQNRLAYLYRILNRPAPSESP